MSNNIVICGEAWGAEEEQARVPFIGASGRELTRMLEQAGIRRVDCYLTNVFQFRPVNNDVETLCVTKSESETNLPPLRPGKYIQAKYLPEIARLKQELTDLRPNIVVALGNTAAWALLGTSGITKIRGTVAGSTLVPGLKCISTYHPAAVLRQWDLRPVTVIDLAKALRESAFPEIRRPERFIYIEPTLKDLDWFWDEFIEHSDLISVDIETAGAQMTCIGFATHKNRAIVVPFTDWRKPGANYWETQEQELQAWLWVRRVLSTEIRKVFHNGLFDLQYTWKAGLTVGGQIEDSMLAHHAMQPESLKGLGFVGSYITQEPAWKLMRTRGSDALKRDE